MDLGDILNDSKTKEKLLCLNISRIQMHSGNKNYYSIIIDYIVGLTDIVGLIDTVGLYNRNTSPKAL